MSVKISDRINKAKTEEDVDKIYTTCCARIDSLLCSSAVEFFVEDYVLCKTHYMIQVKNSYNNSKIKAERDSTDILKILNYMKPEIFKIETCDIYSWEIIGKFNSMYLYKYNNIVVKFSYKKNSQNILKIDRLNYENVKGLFENSHVEFYIKQTKIDKPRVKISKNTIKNTENIKMYLYKEIDHTLYKFLRYCNIDRKKDFILNLALNVKKFHKRYITIGHFSELNIAVKNNKPVFISFFSIITSQNEHYDEFVNKDKTQSLMCDIITSSTNCLLFNFPDKFDDLEMIMWLYLKITNHDIIKEFKDKDDNILSIDKIYKKKINFINKINQDGILNNINSPIRNKFNIVKEVEKFLEYF
jgi:hypothetical protein